jgi:hypothetical protein
MTAAISPRSNFHYKQLETPLRKTPFRQIGFGRLSGADMGERKTRFIQALKNNLQCPAVNVPNIDSVTIHYDGPLTAAEVQGSFGAVINPLGASLDNPPPGATQVDSTFAEPGKFQTYALVCAIQWRFDIDPVMFTAKVNSYTAPTSGVAKPVSPDIFVSQVGGSGNGDFGTTAALGIAAGTLTPAVLEWAWWAEFAFFYMTRGYYLQWQYGHNFNIINDSLRYTAYLPTNAQEGSASSSEIDLAFFLRKVNTYYVNSLNSGSIALAIDRVRAGNESLGAVAGQSVFHPSRSLETVGGTYGGAGLRPMLRGNAEFRRLSAPFLAWPGVPLGLKAQQQSSDDAGLMQAYLDAACGLGGPIPGTFTEFANINTGNTIAGTSGQTGVEPSLDSGGSVANSLELLAQRTVYKGGPFRISVAFKGWELTPDQAELLRSPDVRSTLQESCGCQVGWTGA